MHEVHVPEHGINTWKGFLLHMGTVTLGLLIAIGLEQAVEVLHRHHEAQALREDLHAESEKNREWLTKGIQSDTLILQRMHEQADAAKAGGVQHLRTSLKGAGTPLPDNPVWKSALASQMTSVLNRNEIQIESELDSLYRSIRMIEDAKSVAPAPAFPKVTDGGMTNDFSAMSSQERDAFAQYMRLGQQLESKERAEGIYLLRAEVAVLNGAKTVDEVVNAETEPTRPWETQPTGNHAELGK